MEGFQRYQRFNQIVAIGSLYDNHQQSGAVFALHGWLTGQHNGINPKIAKFNFSIEELRFLELEFP
ncbi:hypothetical protein ACULLL_05730 [Lysinibacillus irui]|uniref:hypothetical protein n=1 Tax=Lysinibacillus irui TaxID=2998077 RepID=UPI004043A7FA